MRLCVAGSRGITGESGSAFVRAAVTEAMEKFSFSMADVTEIVSGMCPNSPDMIGVEGAKRAKIRVKPFYASWAMLPANGAIIRTRRDGTKYNARAGTDRNTEMAKYLAKKDDSVCVIIWNGWSPGSRDMASACLLYGVKHHLYTVPT
jgi:hypothetical protein